MFPIVVNDGINEIPEDDIFYIIGKEGVFLRKKLGVMDSLAPVKNISILESVHATAKMNIEKIPATEFQQIINFFKAVYEEYYAEAIVLLFYNIENGQHVIVCPKQEVSAAGADYNKKITMKGWDMIGTVHSHAGMSAFHSGIDDHDEEYFDGLHITLGNMRDDDISVSCSIVANGFRVIVEPDEYVEGIVKTVDINENQNVPYARTYRWDKTTNKMVPVKTNGHYTKHVYDQRFQIDLPLEVGFPDGWGKQVSKKVWSYNTRKTSGNWYDSWYGTDAHAWKDWQGHKTVTPVQAAKNNKTTTTKVDNITKELNLNKLDDAKKRAIIRWALEQVDGDVKDVIEDSLDDDITTIAHYECVQCLTKISVDESEEAEGEACCPKCKTADYLTEISAAELMMESDPHPLDNADDVDDLITCHFCHSSFTEDFVVNGFCPTCAKPLDLDDIEIHEIADIMQCSDCQAKFSPIRLHGEPACPFCGHEFTALELRTYGVPLTDEMMRELRMEHDAGGLLSTEAEALEAAAKADEDLERIPVPGQASLPINKTQKNAKR